MHAFSQCMRKVHSGSSYCEDGEDFVPQVVVVVAAVVVVVRVKVTSAVAWEP